MKSFHRFISSLATCYIERQEPEALYLLVQLCKPIIVAMLMLLEVFECTGLFGLLLQKGNL